MTFNKRNYLMTDKRICQKIIYNNKLLKNIIFSIRDLH